MEPNTNTTQSSGPTRPRRIRLRWLALAGLVILVLAGALIYWGLRSGPTKASQVTTKKQSPPAVAVVEITSGGFVPSTISVSPNTDVVWVNEDTMPHLPAADPYPSHSSLPSLVAPKALGQHETYTYHFSKVGTVHYQDDLNPTVTGTVVVR